MDIFHLHLSFVNWILLFLIQLFQMVFFCVEKSAWILLFPFWWFYRNGPHWFGRYGAWRGMVDTEICRQMMSEVHWNLEWGTNGLPPNDICNQMILYRFYEWVGVIGAIVIPIVLFWTISCCLCRICIITPVVAHQQNQ